MSSKTGQKGPSTLAGRRAQAETEQSFGPRQPETTHVSAAPFQVSGDHVEAERNNSTQWHQWEPQPGTPRECCGAGPMLGSCPRVPWWMHDNAGVALQFAIGLGVGEQTRRRAPGACSNKAGGAACSLQDRRSTPGWYAAAPQQQPHGTIWYDG